MLNLKVPTFYVPCLFVRLSRPSLASHGRSVVLLRGRRSRRACTRLPRRYPTDIIINCFYPFISLWPVVNAFGDEWIGNPIDNVTSISVPKNQKIVLLGSIAKSQGIFVWCVQRTWSHSIGKVSDWLARKKACRLRFIVRIFSVVPRPPSD